jgi:phosphatidylglycerol:prolipoprotein diacylglycerol transferase
MQLMHKRKSFEGQLFLLYVLVYAAGRFGLEYLRGDESRGHLFGGLLSHSQLISLLLMAAVSGFWFYRARQVRKAGSA